MKIREKLSDYVKLNGRINGEFDKNEDGSDNYIEFGEEDIDRILFRVNLDWVYVLEKNFYLDKGFKIKNLNLK